jgi:hypothetical protein
MRRLLSFAYNRICNYIHDDSHTTFSAESLFLDLPVDSVYSHVRAGAGDLSESFKGYDLIEDGTSELLAETGGEHHDDESGHCD